MVTTEEVVGENVGKRAGYPQPNVTEKLIDE